MKKTILTLIFAILSTVLFSQEIMGRIVDSNTGNPIESATIISGNYATLSNKDGEFTLKNSDKKVDISHVSYYPQSFAVDKVPATVRLAPRSLQLENVEVKANTSLSQRIKVLWRKYRTTEREEIRMGKRQGTFYYRQTTKTDTIYSEYMECFFAGSRGLAAGYLSLIEGRYAAVSAEILDGISLSNHYAFSQLFPVEMSPIHGVGKVQVPLCYNYEKSYRISFIKSINPETDDEIMVYRFEPRPPTPKNAAIIYGDLYVRSRDNAIVQFDGRCDNFVLTFQTPRFRHTAMQLKFVIKYTDNGSEYGYPIIESIKTDANIYYKKILSNKTLSAPMNAKIESILLSIDQNYDRNRRFQSNTTLRENIMDSKYDPTFWKDNPIIKRTEIENKIIEDFTKMSYFGNFKVE